MTTFAENQLDFHRPSYYTLSVSPSPNIRIAKRVPAYHDVL